MKRHYDAIIVGGGVMGTSIGYALAQRKLGRLAVIEQFGIASGATGRSSGVLRCHYGVPELVTMAVKSLHWFRDARERDDLDVGYRKIGYLVGVGPDDVNALRANVAMQKDLGVNVDLVQPLEARDLWPKMNVDDFGLLAYEPEGGVADPAMTASAFQQLGKGQGVEYLLGTFVQKIIVGPGERVVGVVDQDGQQLEAEILIVAAGAWSPTLFVPLGIDVPIRSERAQLILVNPNEPVGHPPVFSDLVNLQYGRPEVNGTILVGNSDHRRPEWVNQSDCPDGVTEDYVHAATEKFLRRFPELVNSQLVGGYSGCYEVTPDYNPIISDTPIAGLYLAAGFSGHGFKLSPVVGELVADLILNQRSADPDIDLSVFRLSRYDEHQPLKSLHPYGGASQMR